MDYRDKEIPRPGLKEDLQKIAKEGGLVLKVYREGNNRIDLVKRKGVKEVLNFLKNSSNCPVGTRVVIQPEKDTGEYIETYRNR